MRKAFLLALVVAIFAGCDDDAPAGGTDAGTDAATDLKPAADAVAGTGGSGPTDALDGAAGGGGGGSGSAGQGGAGGAAGGAGGAASDAAVAGTGGADAAAGQGGSGDAAPAVDGSDAPEAGSDTADATLPSPDVGVAGKHLVFVSGFDPLISALSFDPATGALGKLGTTATEDKEAPSFLAFAKGKNLLYALDDAEESSLAAYTVNATSGALTLVNRVDVGAAGTTHLGLDPSGQWLLSANYESGSVSVFALKPDGSIGDKTDDKTMCMAAHQIVFDASGKYLFVPCKNDDKLNVYTFAAGKLSPHTPASVAVADNPRHLVFDAAEKHVYVLAEASNEVVTFDYDKATGVLNNPNKVSALDENGTQGDAGEIVLHPNGKFLYVSNRIDDSLTVFSLDPSTGAPKAVAWQKTNTAQVRHFSIDPSGKYLVAANQRTAVIAVFQIDPTAGTLTPVGTPLSVPMMPGFVGFWN